MAIGDNVSLEFLGRQQVVLLDEMKEMRREMRIIRQSFISISEHFSRQERRIGELRDDFQTMLRMEIGGAIANLETRLENYVDDRFGAFDTRVAGVEVRLDRFESRIDLLETRMDARFAGFDGQFDQIDTKLDEILSAVRPA